MTLNIWSRKVGFDLSNDGKSLVVRGHLHSLELRMIYGVPDSSSAGKTLEFWLTGSGLEIESKLLKIEQ